jgi:F0F1-type ATP synthase membrane subunit c/vacuolar-type H+-ATPase subunit K
MRKFALMKRSAEIGRKVFLVVGLVLLLFITSRLNLANAQITSSGFAVSIPLNEIGVESGDIICSYEDGFKKCVIEYDSSLYGVIADTASVAVEDTELENSRLLLTNGVATVRVSAIGGNISEGNFITTSEIAGIGKRAKRNGYVLGTAMEDFSSDNSDEIGTIQVAINIHPASGLTAPGSNILRYIREGVTVPVLEPVESLRYILAVLIILIAFTLGMVYFGKSSRAGIDAIGRNPLARRTIQLTVILNIGLTIVIVLVGLGIAYLILIL